MNTTQAQKAVPWELGCSAGNRGGTLMQRIAEGILVLMLNLSVVAAGGNGQDKPATPAEQYKTLRKEYDRTPGSGVPLNDEERLKFVGRAYKHH
jgi:hypothetical protein